MGGGSAAAKSSDNDDSSTASTISDLPPSINDYDLPWNGKLEDSWNSNSGKENWDAMRLRRHRNIYQKILKSYEENDASEAMLARLEETKKVILGYKPGSFIEEAGSLQKIDYEIPRTTTLLLVGPRGSGKSSLVNKISRFFECDDFASGRAQVSYNLSGDGTYFLQEYMVPRGSTSFSVFDTRSLSKDSSENLKLMKNWMLQGVRPGRAVLRASDSPTVKANIKRKAREMIHHSSEKRMVNFVIFVVDGVSLIKSIIDGDNLQYTSIISETFNSPYVSFQDDKPIVVVTHGDELPISERIQLRIHLGELLGISPVTQIFDIPDDQALSTKVAMAKMLRYSLEHADRNLPFKKKDFNFRRMFMILLTVLMVAILSGIVIMKVRNRAFAPRCSEIHVKWHKIRHIW